VGYYGARAGGARGAMDVLLCSEFAMRALRKAWPLLVLLAEVLAFFRHILLYGHYAIPWDFRYYHLS
jgi:hypothetical protein